MPYKNPEDKKRWEREHRQERNERRRSQQRPDRQASISAAQRPAKPMPDAQPKNAWKAILGLAIGFAAILIGTSAGLNASVRR